MGWVKPIVPLRELDLSVGIIGAGPAGLSAAAELRKRGYQVEIYDRYDRVGGLLVYGIPGFKLEKEVVERRAPLLADSGVRFHLGQDVGGDGPASPSCGAATTRSSSRPASTGRGRSRPPAWACRAWSRRSPT